MKALRIYARPAARRHIERHGLQPQDVRTIPGAAGGPKGLILGPLDRFIFGRWLTRSSQPVHLVGASIGAWRLSTACLADPQEALARFAHDYVEGWPGFAIFSPKNDLTRCFKRDFSLGFSTRGSDRGAATGG